MQAEFLLSREQNGRLEAGDTPNRNYRFHFHSHIEICVVTEGELEVWINDQRRVLGEGEISMEYSGEYPVFLFDDVLSELDARRQSFLLSRLEDRQVIMTTCTTPPVKSDAKFISVENGRYE